MKFLFLLQKGSFYRLFHTVFIFSKISLKSMFWKYQVETEKYRLLYLQSVSWYFFMIYWFHDAIFSLTWSYSFKNGNMAMTGFIYNANLKNLCIGASRILNFYCN